MKPLYAGIAVICSLVAVAYRSNRIPEQELTGTYCAEHPHGVDRIRLEPGGIYKQRVLLAGDGGSHVAEGKWQFDPRSDYISFENRLLVSDGFGKLRRDFPNSPKGSSVLPIRRKYFIGGLEIGSSELTPYVRATGADCGSRRAAGHPG